ncbi:MAG: hypothetical protein HYV95_06650 [Opitutae bacterium]|nr:hypothetical protein [Opitutae bacterium]
MKATDSLEGHRVLILTGVHQGEEGVCLGKVTQRNFWAVSPDSSNDVLELTFEREFALLQDLSANPLRN